MSGFKKFLRFVLWTLGIINLLFALILRSGDEPEMDGFYVFGAIALVFIFLAIFSGEKDRRKIREAKEAIEKAEREKIEAEKERERQWQLGEGKDFRKIYDNFWVDEINRKVRLHDEIINWEDIMGSEIINDDEVITTSVQKGYSVGKRGSVGRAVVGGALFGDVGAIVGANTGTQRNKINTTTTTTSENFCDSLVLRIFLDSIDDPHRDITFIEKRVSEDSDKYLQQLEIANKCNSIIKIILNRNTKSYSEES